MRSPWLTVALTCLLAAQAQGARADRVHLVGGAVLEGKATRIGEKVIVEVESGRLTLSAGSVERIESSESNVQRFDAMLQKVAPRDVQGLLTLANFCRAHDMREREREMLSKVLEVEPDQSEARTRLGYVRREGAWITLDDLRRSEGLIEHKGQWLSREQLLQVERLEAETEAAKLERDKARAELEVKRVELRARTDEAEAARRQQQMAQRQPTAQEPSIYFYSAGAYLPFGTPRPPPPALAPNQNPDFPIPGVRDPSDMSFSIPGVRDPRSYF